MDAPVWDQKLPSLREIKAAIPNHLFEPDHKRGALLIARTVVMVIGFYLLAVYALPLLPSPWYEMGWMVYWFFQGTLYWSVFGWGHDAGHGGVSKHAWVNTLVGTIVHSFIFLPYESWRISHREHHRNAGNIDKDINYAPKRDYEIVRKHGLIALLGIAQILYIFGISGSGINHVNPWHPVYKGNRKRVAISLLICCAFVAVYCYLSMIFGWWFMFALHGVPVLGYGTYLILSSFLNHADPKVPWWGDSSWTYMKGNIFSVIDIRYGKLIDWLVQDNGLHQIHHLFPSVPTYHMTEATTYFRKAFPHLVKDRDVGVMEGFVVYLKNFMNQRKLSDDIDVFFYDGINAEKEKIKIYSLPDS
jgi:omega-3 fatty acid desaturase (delta-15 desaturase)